MKYAGETYEQFSERVFGTPYMIWHDGPATDNLRHLSGEEKEHAARMLLIGLAEGDPSAVEGFGELDPQLGLPHIKKLFPGGTAGMRLAVAMFLLKHDPEKDLRALAQSVMSTVTSPSVFYSGVILLRHFPLPEVTSLLLDIVSKSSDYLMRYHAADSLLVLGNVQPADVGEHRDIFVNIIGEGMEAADVARHATAAEQLRRLTGF